MYKLVVYTPSFDKLFIVGSDFKSCIGLMIHTIRKYGFRAHLYVNGHYEDPDVWYLENVESEDNDV